MYLIVWRYRVPPAEVARFEAAYGPSGDWSRLFDTGDGYLGSELVRGEAGEYLTIDRWESAAAAAAFMTAHGDEYRRLDEAMADLTDEEERIFGGSVLA